MTQTVPAQQELQGWVSAIANLRCRHAFSDLFEFFGPRLKTYFMKTGLTGEQAEDIVQDVMIQVWRKADQYSEDRASVSGWIFMIAKSRMIDGLRKTRAPELDPEDPILQPKPQAQPESSLQIKETTGQLRDLIRDLPEEQQAVLRASFYQGLSHSEIAKRFELPLGTVKSRLRLAVASMRDELSTATQH